jgi:Protein of unknown function (DUF2934)
MAISDIAAIVTGERLFGKNTGARERPSRDEIARLAFEFYEARGRREGQDVDDWLSAEQQLTHHYRSVPLTRLNAGKAAL